MSARMGDTGIQRLTRLSKGATIGLILVVIALLAGLGILAGALYDHPNVPLEPAGGQFGVAPHSSSLVAYRGAPAGGARLFSPRTQVSPSPIVGPSVSPTPDGGGGGVYDLGGVAQIQIPDPWAVLADDPGYPWALFQYDGNGDYAYAEVGSADAAADPTGVLLSAFDAIVGSSSSYSQLKVGDPKPLQPFGSITGRAVMAYTGLFGDPQSAQEFFGNFWVALRNDGTAMVFSYEVYPPDNWDADLDFLVPVYISTFESFAGAPLPT